MSPPPAMRFRRDRTPVEGGWELVGSDGDGRPLRLAFGETELARAYLGLVIGRHPDLVDRLLKDAAVSRRHCRIGVAEGGLFIEDLNSLNGTAVDGLWLAPFRPVALRPGQEIRLGRVRLAVGRLGEEGHAP